MFLPETEDFLTLYVDPGETAGWVLACGATLLAAGQERLWYFADDVWNRFDPEEASALKRGPDVEPFMHWDSDNEYLLDLPIGRIVFENFRLYKSKASSMIGDEFRTIRLIGALCMIARIKGLDIHDQPASIKTQAEVGGAEAFFLRPLHENRHANDALRHFWYFAQFGPDGDERVPDRKGKDLNA